MTRTPTTTVRAPAKLTVTLRVTGVRADGYHLLDAEMVTLELADVLTFAAGDGLAIGGPAAGGVPADDSNLVRRALRAVGRTAAVHVDKRIPAGGGLGGGSADAAAVLRWAGCDDLDLAVGLGADVPFCLVGGRARVSGIGEVVEPRPLRRHLHPVHAALRRCRPPRCTAAWDDLGGPTADGPQRPRTGGARVEPRLAEWRDRLRAATGRRRCWPAAARPGSWRATSPPPPPSSPRPLWS